MPSAPGYVPKNESNDLFSCMMTTTCRILWMPVSTDGEGRGDWTGPGPGLPVQPPSTSALAAAITLPRAAASRPYLARTRRRRISVGSTLST